MLDHVDQRLRDLLAAQQLRRVARLVLHPHRRLHDVSHELPAVGVAEGALVAQLPGLGDVVQEDAGDHQVAVEVRVKPAHRVGHLDGVEGVLEQAADVSVMHAHRGGCFAQLDHERLILEIAMDER